jgi:hypothetical protein
MLAGGNEFGVELLLELILSELCWIDEREADWNRVQEQYLWGSARVRGQLAEQAYKIPEYISEIASTYAQVAHRLKYFRPARLLLDAEWSHLKRSLDDAFFMRDWRRSELQERFGAPSLEVPGSNTIVACYAHESASEPWLFFDLSLRRPGSAELFNDPILRDVRMHRNRFELLPFAEWCGQGRPKEKNPAEYRQHLEAVCHRLKSIAGDCEIRGNGMDQVAWARTGNRSVEISWEEDTVFVSFSEDGRDSHLSSHLSYEAAIQEGIGWLTANVE